MTTKTVAERIDSLNNEIEQLWTAYRRMNEDITRIERKADRTFIILIAIWVISFAAMTIL